VCYDQIAEQVKAHGITKQIMKQAAPITVTTFDETMKRYAEPLMLPAHRGEKPLPSGYYILREQFRSCYSSDMGLQFLED
jgi:hypothetical protein